VISSMDSSTLSSSTAGFSEPSPRANFERGLSRRTSSQHGKTLRGIAIRQLSQNLTRQDSTKKENPTAEVAPTGVGGFRSRRPKLSLSLIDGSSQSFATVENKYGDEQNGTVTYLAPIAEVTPRSSHENKSNSFVEQAAATTASTSSSVKKSKRPNLQLVLSENDDNKTVSSQSPVKVEAVVPAAAVSSGTSAKSKPGRRPMNLQLVESDADDDMESRIASQVEEQSARQVAKGASTPNHPFISPRGTFLLGDIRINSDGIRPKADQQVSRGHGEAPVMRGMDFLEVRPLGSGASGVVMEAIHVPTLTIVALKMLPVYSQEKCENLSRELVILHKNLAALSIVDNSLDEGSSDNNASSRKCPNLLSLFNAFVNVKNGMVCLVMEYMDGGSLDDLVKNGGCNDEYVLSDIARQGLTGLAFLHKNKSVHRDIKPANILCSSSGIVKIADFGISKVMDGAGGMAKTFVGTVIYMSP
jgi:hypothetical protein